MYRIVLSVALLVVLTAPARGGWDEGWDAYKRRDYTTATREFMVLAEQGDARAQVTLQIMEVFDEGGPKDLDKLEKWRNTPNRQNRREAVKWFRNAANQGDTKAWTLLSSMYGEGYGLPQDSDESMNLLRKAAEQGLLKAAEQGEVLAQKYLAFFMSFANKMTESNYWIRKAAEQGDRWAQRHLGARYMHGPNADELLAYMWLDLAAAQGARGAAEARDQLAIRFNTIKELGMSLFDKDRIDEAKKLVQEWKEKHKSGEAQTAAVAPPPEPEDEGTPSCLAGATFGPIAEGSPWFGRVEGVQVVDVEPGSLASQMKLRKHDLVVKVMGQQVRDLDEFGAAMRKLGGGPGLTLLLRRDRQRNLNMIAC